MDVAPCYSVAASSQLKPLFSPFCLGRINLCNRLVVAPMTRVSSTEDGLATPRMADYYSTLAEGGLGLVLTEGIYTDRAYAQGNHEQPGLNDTEQTAARRVVGNGVHATGGEIISHISLEARVVRTGGVR